jgi:hypothetical protein
MNIDTIVTPTIFGALFGLSIGVVQQVAATRQTKKLNIENFPNIRDIDDISDAFSLLHDRLRGAGVTVSELFRQLAESTEQMLAMRQVKSYTGQVKMIKYQTLANNAIAKMRGIPAIVGNPSADEDLVIITSMLDDIVYNEMQVEEKINREENDGR